MENINISIVKDSSVKGLLATFALLIIYFTIVTLISGWGFAQSQFREFWFFIITLAIGFGIQVGLFTYLKNAIKQNTSPRVLAISGTTSTVAMVSCCTHYLVNILPILGAVGIITVISSYQVQLFWVGLIFNLLGISYLANRAYRFTRGI